MRRFFFVPAAVSCLILAAVFFWGGTDAFVLVGVLSVLEVTLSFDNAVVNAQALAGMSAAWRRRFVNWGILVAVFGTRLVLPILLVSAATAASPLLIARLAFSDGAAYAALLSGARFAIDAFGGAFLAMVSLRYFFNEAKTVHWIRGVERKLALWGDITAVEMAVTLALLIATALLVPPGARAAVLFSGAAAVAVSALIDVAIQALSGPGISSAARGVALFAYLEILDTAFSLDGVVGAFALTSSVLFIVLGLGIGAYFVRSLTIFLVERRTLESLLFIEHGAHWAIFGLSMSMFASLLVPVPEFVTGTIGLAFMLASFYSSLRARRGGAR